MFRFKVEQKIDLRSMLQDLGIKKVFTNDADLSAMTGNVQLQQNADTYFTHIHTSSYNKHMDTDMNRINNILKSFSITSNTHVGSKT